MKELLSWVSMHFLKLVRFFSHNDRASERKFFGLGQFVLLLTLAPFVFNLTLFSFGGDNEVASHYEYEPDRFEPLPLFPDFPSKPIAPKKLSKWENQRLQICKHPPFIAIILKVSAKECRLLSQKIKNYHSGVKKYQRSLAQYQKDLIKFEKVEAEYKAFEPKLSSKPQDFSSITIKQRSSRSFSTLLGAALAVSVWQDISGPIWFLGLLLIIPTVLLCIRRQHWGLLTFGLSVPAFNYVLFILVAVLGLDTLTHWQINSLLVPKIAFAWFALRGHIFSKSFAIFILLMSACAILPSLLGEQGYHATRAQLPILVFIAACLIARLLVKGVQENTYLLHNLGWSRSLRTGLHSFVLWLPMAVLAFPFFYVTEVAIPKHAVNKLHESKVLQFNHQHDMLDNALQSTAVKADDAMYAWHLTIESMKTDIYNQGAKLENIDLKQMVEEKYDAVMPKGLEFDDYESDAFIVAPIVELSVDASLDSTNKAFKKLRGSIKKSLAQIAEDNEQQFKSAIKRSKREALKIVYDIYVQGRDSILETNRSAQASLWWTLNYARAAHQLSILFFVFVCIKSLAYVFARVSFNRDTGTFITLGNTEGAVQNNMKSQIKRAGLQYLMHGDREETFYISRRFQCRGKAPKFTIPQPFHAPIARLFNGAISMNKVTMQQGDDEVSCTAAQGIEFFEWDLRDGEEVIFDFHNFVGMSESVKIATLISTRISSLLLGKMIYSQAIGPGKLILMAKGRAEITDSENNGGSLPPERLIAMQTNTRLHIDSELDMVNIYLSTAYVRPAGGGQVIVDVDSQRGTKTGLGSFIKRFILPI